MDLKPDHIYEVIDDYTKNYYIVNGQTWAKQRFVKATFEDELKSGDKKQIPMKSDLKFLSDLNVGDQIRLPALSCGCCINYRTDLQSLDNYPHIIVATYLGKDQTGAELIGWKPNEKACASAHPLDAKKFPAYSVGIYLAPYARCEVVTPSRASIVSNHSLGFLIACIGVGAGIAHSTRLQATPKETVKTLSK